MSNTIKLEQKMEGEYTEWMDHWQFGSCNDASDCRSVYAGSKHPKIKWIIWLVGVRTLKGFTAVLYIYLFTSSGEDPLNGLSFISWAGMDAIVAYI